MLRHRTAPPDHENVNVDLFDQLQFYAHDLNRTLKAERLNRKELLATQQQLLKYATDLKKTHESERQRAWELQAAYVETIRRLTHAAEYKDEETANHIQRISHYARTLAHELAGRPNGSGSSSTPRRCTMSARSACRTRSFSRTGRSRRRNGPS